MRRFIPLLFIGLALACTNIDDAEPSGKENFIKFYHGPGSFSAVDLIQNGDGYTLLGNLTINQDSSIAFLLVTNLNGDVVTDPVYFPSIKATGIVKNQAGDGYILIGDSLIITPEAERVADIEVYSTKILEVSNSGTVLNQLTLKDTTGGLLRSRAFIDFKSDAVNRIGSEYILLGTYREDLTKPEKSFIFRFTEALDTVEINALQVQDALIDYNYINSKSVFATTDHYIWAASFLKSTGGFNEAFVGIPFVKAGSNFDNYSLLGENTSQQLIVRQITPSLVPGAGYGIVGTRAENDGSKSNIFFMKVDANGNLVSNSDKYYDIDLSSASLEPVEPATSSSNELGETIAATPSGYVLAGATQSGSESTNLFVAKIDLAGFPVWIKKFGGDGSESVNSVKVNEDGSILVLGTNTNGGLSSLFLIKLSADGTLTE